jgi:hypothetical protein
MTYDDDHLEEEERDLPHTLSSSDLPALGKGPPVGRKDSLSGIDAAEVGGTGLVDNPMCVQGGGMQPQGHVADDDEKQDGIEDEEGDEEEDEEADSLRSIYTVEITGLEAHEPCSIPALHTWGTNVKESEPPVHCTCTACTAKAAKDHAAVPQQQWSSAKESSHDGELNQQRHHGHSFPLSAPLRTPQQPYTVDNAVAEVKAEIKTAAAATTAAAAVAAANLKQPVVLTRQAFSVHSKAKMKKWIRALQKHKDVCVDLEGRDYWQTQNPRARYSGNGTAGEGDAATQFDAVKWPKPMSGYVAIAVAKPKKHTLMTCCSSLILFLCTCTGLIICYGCYLAGIQKAGSRRKKPGKEDDTRQGGQVYTGVLKTQWLVLKEGELFLYATKDVAKRAEQYMMVNADWGNQCSTTRSSLVR